MDDLRSAGRRELRRTSRTWLGDRERANPIARSMGVCSLRNRARRISRRSDHLGCSQTARTSPAPDSGLSKACRTMASVSLGFSSATSTTRGSGSSSSAAATRPDARRAKDKRAPDARDSRRFSKVSSAASLMSPATMGLRVTCIRSKVNNCRRSDIETWRGVLGCPTRASFTFRPVAALLLPSRSRTSDGRSARCSSARARSSLKAGSAAAA